MAHYVYKYVLNDEIIYIGKSNSDTLSDRLKYHGKMGDNIDASGWKDINVADIYYCELANAIMTDVVESELIRRYKPKYNKNKKSEWDGLDFELNWKKFDKSVLQPKTQRKKEAKTTITLVLHRSLRDKVKRYAFYNDTTMSELFAAWIEEHCTED